MYALAPEVVAQLQEQAAQAPTPVREVITIECDPAEPVAQQMGIAHEPTPWPEPFDAA